ncbi:MAG: tRNA preQ1(34) S-adenosylmethionine ribosyltransferase-isomerase QueA [Pyrinomonadaceae bacterium]|nr:tRNA preQ1(34) S-adenosylmethionine ribosyltransferase-isomerase QueA [Pyrinomonadaceae bacterium]
MHVSDFDFDLPEELIAQHGLADRDRARMLVLNRARARWQDSTFSGFPFYTEAGDAVVVNNTRVFPARLKGVREASGGGIELLLLREGEGGVWDALARPARRLKAGDRLSFGAGRLRAEVVEVLPEGKRRLRFQHEEDFNSLLDEIGETPLPPYIKRDEGIEDEDRERYQTIFAHERGSIAAPTAGLHWTPRVREELTARGVRLIEVTLHVGYGTFEPVRVEDLREHRVAAERFEITEAAARALNSTREGGKRIIAVGTTTARALESAADEAGRVAATTNVGGERETDLTITPGYEFRVVNGLLTNFHLPCSSLLFLVAAFAGREKVLAAYRHAVRERYRFYSYGDCMLIT